MKRFLAAIALASAAALPAAAQTVAIVNAKVAPMTGGPEVIENGTVIIRDGRVAAVGAGLAPPAGAQLIDAGGGWVTPGIIPALSTLGIVEVAGVRETGDARARDSVFQASLDVSTGVNPASIHIPVVRSAGITRAVVAPSPSREVFAGQGAVVSMGAGAEPVLKARAFQVADLSAQGGELAGGSRPAAFAIFRNALREAQDYARNPARWEGGRSRDSILKRRDAEALVPVVEGREPIVIHVERAQDIRNVLGLKREFPALKLILSGAGEGWMVAREIAASGTPVLTTALTDLPENFDILGSTQSNVGRMVAAGVKVALAAYGETTQVQPRSLPTDAGNLVALTRLPGATGVSHAQALALITRAPAEIFGMTDVGTIQPGKVADIVVWSGDPLELSSTPTAVLISGRPQPLGSRQTELRDRYLRLQPGDLPYQYKRP